MNYRHLFPLIAKLSGFFGIPDLRDDLNRMSDLKVLEIGPLENWSNLYEFINNIETAEDISINFDYLGALAMGANQLPFPAQVQLRVNSNLTKLDLNSMSRPVGFEEFKQLFSRFPKIEDLKLHFGTVVGFEEQVY